MRRWMMIGFGAWIAAFAGCVLGSAEEPGCSEDAECEEGFSCRAGACFKETIGGASAPPDAGSDADAN